jgi:hypothetical protein
MDTEGKKSLHTNKGVPDSARFRGHKRRATPSSQGSPGENEVRSDRRATASRLNGKKSLGPVSPAGKARSSRNAITHGLTAFSQQVLLDEDPLEYRELMEATMAEWQPVGSSETEMAGRICNLQWRLRRASRTERQIFLGQQMSCLIADRKRDDQGTEIGTSFSVVPNMSDDGLLCMAKENDNTSQSLTQVERDDLMVRIASGEADLATPSSFVPKGSRTAETIKKICEEEGMVRRLAAERVMQGSATSLAAALVNDRMDGFGKVSRHETGIMNLLMGTIVLLSKMQQNRKKVSELGS